MKWHYKKSNYNTPSGKTSITKNSNLKSSVITREKNRSKERLNNGKKILEVIFNKAREKAAKPIKKIENENLKKRLTLIEFYKSLTLKSHIVKLYVELMQCPMGRPPDKIHIKDFILFTRRIYDGLEYDDIKDAFIYLAKTGEIGNVNQVKENQVKEDKLFIFIEDLTQRYDEYIDRKSVG